MALSLWRDRLTSDRPARDDFVAWIGARRAAVVEGVFSGKLALDEARGAKNLLDELERYATMNDREERANERFNAGTARSTVDG